MYHECWGMGISNEGSGTLTSSPPSNGGLTAVGIRVFCIGCSVPLLRPFYGQMSFRRSYMGEDQRQDQGPKITKPRARHALDFSHAQQSTVCQKFFRAIRPSIRVSESGLVLD